MLETVKDIMSNDELKLNILSCVLLLVSNIFAAIAVYHDCRLCNIKRTGLITAVTVIFGLPAVALYFIVRRWLKQEVATVCRKCGKRIKKGQKVCPKCGGSYFVPRSIENRSEITTKVIACLIIAAVMLGVRTWVTQYSPLAQQADEQLAEEMAAYGDGEEPEEYENEAEDIEYSVFD